MVYATNIRSIPPDVMAELLAGKLAAYKRSDAIVIATTPLSIPLSQSLGRHLTLDVIDRYCKELRSPGQRGVSIGSITADEVTLHDRATRLPRGYIEHQIQLLKRNLKTSDLPGQGSLEGRALLLVREEISTADQLRALLIALHKENPGDVIVVTPVISRKARLDLENDVQRLIYLIQETGNLRSGWKRASQRELQNSGHSYLH